MGESKDLEKVEEILKSLDSLTQQVSELEISETLEKFAKKEYGENCGENIPETLRAEMMAFDFMEDYTNSETGWGTYFGPMSVLPIKEKGIIEIPSIQSTTPSIIDYWEKRANESKNPILKARYADLVWDFAEKIKRTKPDYKIAVIAIESIIDIADRDLHKYQISVITKLKRALSLALSLNNKELISKVKDTIIAYENKVAEDDKLGLWGFSFDLLLKNKNVQLTPEEKDRIIQDLEERLSRLSKSSDYNFWAAENASLRLTEYYNLINKKEDAKKVLLTYGKIVQAAVSIQPSAQVAIAWLERLFHIYMQYGLKNEANNVSIEIRKLGAKANSELKTIEASVTIPTKEIEEFINALIDGDLKTALARVTVYYIPKKEEVKKQLDDLSKEVPIQFLFTSKIQDSSGRIIATIGPLKEDVEGHVISQISQNISFSSIFLRDTIKALVSKFNLDAKTIMDYLYESPIFEEDRRAFIAKGVEEYLNGDYIVALHILIPQIEALIRNLEEKTGGAVFKLSRFGGFNYRTLDDMLWDENIRGVLGEDATLYFRVLLVDPRGWNLRNNICHGISAPETLNATTSDRVFHSLLCLSLIRERGENRE
jgi:hypothetical protein